MSTSSDPKMKSRRNEGKDKKFELVLQNGSTLSKQLITDCNVRNCMIKRFSEEEVLGLGEGDAYNDMVISARVSNHKNFLKLLGCCLQFPLPVLVFDGAENGVLDQHGDACNGNNKMVLSWNQKLKIAKDVANAVTYLHTAFPRIITET
ncbi:hypothetical protein F2Q69_00014851 [Brassica cretica]|uniref:Serine-threonine/tyrosine-protein kinase catalytic domain-containing protein n=1 Tax=Brassica cretica TaxID=69181 RepID=A0A8S9QWV5_BRACR|nr:hypothetical protein F2Q69_00014851 [Brassica cretica]